MLSARPMRSRPASPSGWGCDAVGKKNLKDREKRRQKKIAKQKAGRASRLAAYRAKHVPKVPEALKGAQSLPQLSEEDYIFWLCHGANYLASDSSQGLWTPLFDSIYEDALPKAEEVAQKVMMAYQEDLAQEGSLTGVPRAVLVWTVTDRAVVSVYKHEAVRRLREKDPECDAEALARAPHNPTVWSLMDQVKARTLAAGVEMDAEEASEKQNEEDPGLEPVPDGVLGQDDRHIDATSAPSGEGDDDPDPGTEGS